VAADWTTIVTAAIAGGAGVVTGVVAARYQARTSIGQQQTQVELLKRQQDQGFREKRSAVYQAFLEAERTFQTLVFSAQQLDRKTFAAWQEGFDRALVSVQLIGAPPVRAEVETFASVFPGRLKVPRTGNAEADSQAIRHGYMGMSSEVRAGRARVIEAMRADVASLP
jgi:hypothetical protein